MHIRTNWGWASGEDAQLVFSPSDSNEFSALLDRAKRLTSALDETMRAINDCRFNFSLNLSGDTAEIPKLDDIKDIIEEEDE